MLTDVIQISTHLNNQIINQSTHNTSPILFPWQSSFLSKYNNNNKNKQIYVWILTTQNPEPGKSSALANEEEKKKTKTKKH